MDINKLDSIGNSRRLTGSQDNESASKVMDKIERLLRAQTLTQTQQPTPTQQFASDVPKNPEAESLMILYKKILDMDVDQIPVHEMHRILKAFDTHELRVKLGQELPVRFGQKAREPFEIQPSMLPYTVIVLWKNDCGRAATIGVLLNVLNNISHSSGTLLMEWVEEKASKMNPYASSSAVFK